MSEAEQAAIRDTMEKEYSEKNWKIDESDVEFTTLLGQGAAGKVYKGLYKGNTVAIKVFYYIFLVSLYIFFFQNLGSQILFFSRT